MSQEVVFRDDVTVELVKSSASDADVIWAARVSTAGEQSLDEIGEDPARSAGLINYLARERHGSPFEHTSMTFFVSAPIFVFREFMRHRIASYNEESGRYRELKPVFYIPSKERKLIQVGKTGAYTFEDEFVAVNHSIPDALAIAIHTKAGTVLHTGDKFNFKWTYIFAHPFFNFTSQWRDAMLFELC